MAVNYGSCDYCDRDAWQFKNGEYVCPDHSDEPWDGSHDREQAFESWRWDRIEADREGR